MELPASNLSAAIPFAAVDPTRALTHLKAELSLPPGLEIQIGPDDKLPYCFLEQGMRAGRAVCKIKTSGVNYEGRSGNWSGTGWLIAPDLLLTNHHVLNSAATAAAADAIFGYEMDASGEPRVTKRFKLNPTRCFITHPVIDAQGKPGLDFSIVGIDPAAAAEYGHVKILRNAEPVRGGLPANIIQHPEGDPKEVAIHDAQVLRDVAEDVAFVRYSSDTNPGSSGAPVFDNQWAPFALHHASRRSDPGAQAPYENEGILLRAIASHLEGLVNRGQQEEEATLALMSFRGADPQMGVFGAAGRSSGGASGVEAVVERYRGETDDLDVGFWNIEWFNKNYEQKLEGVAKIILEMNLDIWGLSETSLEATQALRDRLNQRPGVKFECLGSAPDAPSSKQNTAVLWNTATVDCKAGEWPEQVEQWLQADSRKFDDLSLEAVDGKIFDRYPGLFKVRMKKREGKATFDFNLVPLHLKAMGEGSKRRVMASKILAAAVAKTSEEQGESDWVLGGDYNAELASGDFAALQNAGLLVLSAQDEQAGGFSYAKSPKSLIDHIFVTADVTAQHGATDYFIVAKDKTVNDYIKSISDHRPVVARFQLKREVAEESVEATPVLPGLQEMLDRLYP